MALHAHSMPGGQNVSRLPLCVDLDGTLLRVDTLHVQFRHLLRKRPVHTCFALASLARGRSHFKEALCSAGPFDPSNLPRNVAFVEWLHLQHECGWELHLVTASHMRVAKAIAEEFGIFSSVMASSRSLNLDGRRKRDALVSRFGERQFDYAGNSRADLHVWPAARHAIVVNARAEVAQRARQIANVLREFPPLS